MQPEAQGLLEARRKPARQQAAVMKEASPQAAPQIPMADHKTV